MIAFPFSITRAGEKIIETWILQNQSKPPQSFWGSRLVDIFKLRRPKGLRVDWKTVIQMNLVIFELELIRSDPDAEHGERTIGHSMGERNDELGKSDLSCAVEAAQTGAQQFVFNINANVRHISVVIFRFLLSFLSLPSLAERQSA